MGIISRNQSFMKMKVDILRPALIIDVTTIRDRILSNYILITANARTFIEPVHSSTNMNKELGGIEVATMVGFFAKGTNIQVNDILRENANPYNNNKNVYWKVIGKLDYSRYNFHIRVDLDVMAYQRGQGMVI